ncbi:MAG TPA: GNAT family N-acetyltransferase [Polyangiaceae bacterium]
MAALSQARRVSVRGPLPGEGTSIAALWRELWDAHEAWGGYPGARDARVYAEVARRLDDDARVRSGHPILGRHIHLVADLGGVACGQVEGWFERHGIDPLTPFTCEVRSLVVTQRARNLGAGRALLEALAVSARTLSAGAPCVLAAEVLEPNPAQAFYERVGYLPVAYGARLEATAARRAPPLRARVAVPHDALAIARLETTLAARRRFAGDLRFDRPHALEATVVGAIAAHLGSPASVDADPSTLVALDEGGEVRAAASFTVQALQPPFVPMRRALLGRFAVDPAQPCAPLVHALVSLACRLALAQAASTLELTDLSAPDSELHAAAIATGAVPWSRVVTRLA